MKIVVLAVLAMFQVPGQPNPSRYAECWGKGNVEFNNCMGGSNDWAKAELCESRRQIAFSNCMMYPGEIVD